MISAKKTDEINEILRRVSEKLSSSTPALDGCEAFRADVMPSVAEIKDIMALLGKVVFPEFFATPKFSATVGPYLINVHTNRLFILLQRQITAALHFCGSDDKECYPIDKVSFDRALMAVEELPELKRILYTDVRAIFNSDPAVSDETQVILCYPSIKAMLHHRFSHLLHKLDVPLLPRIISELAHSATGIDIHPGATIGEFFAIDHGTGVVIGETCIIGNHVTIYQGVTLGAKNFTLDDAGHPINLPRHPIIEDNVTIYSNASVLGRITIGHDSVIGGNVWLTESVPPNSRILNQCVRSI